MNLLRHSSLTLSLSLSLSLSFSFSLSHSLSLSLSLSLSFSLSHFLYLSLCLSPSVCLSFSLSPPLPSPPNHSLSAHIERDVEVIASEIKPGEDGKGKYAPEGGERNNFRLVEAYLLVDARLHPKRLQSQQPRISRIVCMRRRHQEKL